MKLISMLCVGLLLMLPSFLAAHPGHDEVTLLIGTVTRIEGERVYLDTFDQASLQRKTVWVVMGEQTKLLLGKKRVDALQLAAGQRVESMVRLEDTPDGSTLLRAIQIRFNPPKQ